MVHPFDLFKQYQGSVYCLKQYVFYCAQLTSSSVADSATLKTNDSVLNLMFSVGTNPSRNILIPKNKKYELNKNLTYDYWIYIIETLTFPNRERHSHNTVSTGYAIQAANKVRQIVQYWQVMLHYDNEPEKKIEIKQEHSKIFSLLGLTYTYSIKYCNHLLQKMVVKFWGGRAG